VNRIFACALLATVAGMPNLAVAQDNAAELAKDLQNPIAALISLPLESNYDHSLGPNGDGWQYKLNIQPVIPVSISPDWNLISRTILPVITQDGVSGSGSQTGLGDIVQSFFFSPKAPTAGGWIWGAGPVLLVPTATNNVLGSEKWGAGPTAVALKQENGWTYGILANHIWSFAGTASRSDVSATLIQPFLAYTTPKQTTFATKVESTYDWENKQWTVPINLTIAQLIKIDTQAVQFEFGYRYYLDKPDNGPHWGLRFTVTLLFPTQRQTQGEGTNVTPDLATSSGRHTAKAVD
jgi:hypothetical protein